MTINPLDFPGNPVQFEAVNLKPDAGHNKDGIPYYKLTMFFRNFEEWEVFQKASLKGASFAVVMNRVDIESAQVVNTAADDPFIDANREAVAERKKKSPKGPLELRAYELCRDKMFWEYLFAIGTTFYGGDATPKNEDVSADWIKQKCGVSHRFEIDKSRESAIAFGILVNEFEKWQRSK